ncbi:MAG: hypothetical protein ACTH3S_17220, partial [Marinobacter sp.]|uniref:hypothetical protein n=1 Tax=Marinobacter sp. TaxID=50741 RepID=UPI003F9E66D4
MITCNKNLSRLSLAMNGVQTALGKPPKARYLISIVALALGMAMLDVPPVRAQTDLQIPPSWIDQQNAEPLSGLTDLRQELEAESDGRLDLIRAYQRMLLHDPQIHAARA